MAEHKFEYGPLARGTYYALLASTPVVAAVNIDLLVYFLPLMVFLGLGLRPALEKSGLYDRYQEIFAGRKSRRNKELGDKRAQDIERRTRDDRYRRSRSRDARLPKNW